MPTDTLTFLALGDSYTVGTGIPLTDSWPVQLGKELRFSTTILAENGWRTEHLLDAIASQDLLPAYDLVSLLIGVNDQYDGFGLTHFQRGLNELLDTALTMADNRPERVFVVSIPDYSYTPKGGNDRVISAEVASFNAVLRKEAGRRGVAFLDIVAISSEAGTDPELVAGDDLHPSGRQYRRWVDEVLLNGVRQLLTT